MYNGTAVFMVLHCVDQWGGFEVGLSRLICAFVTGALNVTHTKWIHKMDYPASDWPMADFPQVKYPMEDHAQENRKEEQRCLQQVETLA